ncbi:YfcC family protein [Peptoniphilus genitalis]|uniref:TIGR00366 family protein n=1 Tax=Peptoniphilus genitalis TaxID=3036303 RepID=A0ABY4TJD0_9FIRM|nr:SLC13 family permease [Peptoniphilus sp. SAHP1]URN40550.1 TIGR00366 family protein [Peptoniphilus sp. SAHP1]
MDEKKRKFKFKAPDALVLICILMVLCAVLTYILPAGTYERFTDPATQREMVDPASYHRVQNTPVSPWKVLKAIHEGMNESAPIINFLFIIGGAFGVLTDTGALDALIHRTSVKLKGKEKLVIVFFLTFWALGGAFLGNFEECLAFIPMQIALCYALGFDSITGVALGLWGVGIGYMGGIMNPFTLGLAQDIAGLPIYSGMGLRIGVWLLALLGGIAFLYSYANKIHKNPQASLTYEIDLKNRDIHEEIEEIELTGRHKAILLVFVLSVIWIIYGVVNHGFYLTEMAAVFVVMVILMGIVAKMSPDDIVASFVKGAGNLLYACICVGFARGLTIIMTEGNILDVIVHGATSVLNGLPALVSAPMTFIVVSVINLFIPSGSGKAVIMMPIMVPMADVLGITRQTVALAYHMGDAITNLVTPAGAPLMAALAMANIPWTTWMKFFMKFFIYLMILGCLACVFAITINYGPF